MIHLCLLIAAFAALRIWGPDDAIQRIDSGASQLRQRIGLEAAQDAVRGNMGRTLSRADEAVYDSAHRIVDRLVSGIGMGWDGLRHLPSRAWNAIVGSDAAAEDPTPKPTREQGTPSQKG
jgi:hypothetical protein